MKAALVLVLVSAACGGAKDEPAPAPPPPIVVSTPLPPPPPEAFCFNNRQKETLHGRAVPPTTCAATLTKCNDSRTTTDGECLPVQKAFSIKLMKNDGKVELGWMFATEADCRVGFDVAKKMHANPDEIVAGCWYDGKRLDRTPKLAVTSIEPGSGDASGGTYVRILGSGFVADGARGAKVYFGSRLGTVVRFASDSELIVQAPNGKVGEVVDVLVMFEPGGEVKIPNEGFENKKGFTFVEKKL